MAQQKLPFGGEQHRQRFDFGVRSVLERAYQTLQRRQHETGYSRGTDGRGRLCCQYESLNLIVDGEPYGIIRTLFGAQQFDARQQLDVRPRCDLVRIVAIIQRRRKQRRVRG